MINPNTYYDYKNNVCNIPPQNKSEGEEELSEGTHASAMLWRPIISDPNIVLDSCPIPEIDSDESGMRLEFDGTFNDNGTCSYLFRLASESYEYNNITHAFIHGIKISSTNLLDNPSLRIQFDRQSQASIRTCYFVQF